VVKSFEAIFDQGSPNDGAKNKEISVASVSGNRTLGPLHQAPDSGLRLPIQAYCLWC